MSLATLAEIGIKAIRLQEAIDHRKVIGKQFGEACANWKRANHLYDFIAKHSDEWDRMMNGVSAEYSAIRRAKDDEKNARARLSRACLKAQKELAAGASTGVIAAIQMLIAYDSLPGSMEDLRALIDQQGACVGVKHYRNPPKSPTTEDEKLVAETVLTQLRAIYDRHWKNLSVDGSGLLNAAIDELEGVMEDRKAEGAIHLAGSLIKGCFHIEQAKNGDSLLLEALGFQYQTLESASISYGFPQEGCEALATGIRAGIKRHRDPPQPPIRRVEGEERTALIAVRVHAGVLADFLWDAKTTAEGNKDLRAANDFLMAEGIAKFIGAIADQAVDQGGFIGGAIEWSQS